MLRTDVASIPAAGASSGKPATQVNAGSGPSIRSDSDCYADCGSPVSAAISCNMSRALCKTFLLIVLLSCTACGRRGEDIEVYRLNADVAAGHILVESDVSALVVPPLPADVHPQVDAALIGPRPVTHRTLRSFIGRKFVTSAATGDVLAEDMLE